MKTDDLINALAVDTATRKPPVSRTVWIAAAIGTVVSAALLVATIGVRDDLLFVAAQSLDFALKVMFTVAVTVPAYFVYKRSARPDGNPAALTPVLIALPLAVLAGGVCYALMSTAVSDVGDVVLSPNWSRCMIVIPLLSIAPLVATLYALRQGAPANPTAAGAAAGLLSSGLAATLYATHCDADSPLFFAVWYPLGIAAMTMIGAVIGSRILRW